MVVIALPSAADTVVTQERTALPSISTVQAPHWAMPQPYLVPVRPSVSRSTHKSGVRGSAFACNDFPLTFRTAMAVSIGSVSLGALFGSGKTLARGDVVKKAQWRIRASQL